MQKSPSCPSCQCIFSPNDKGWQNKNPLLLSCGHTFCTGCLNKLVNKDKTSIICPTCKKVTSLPGDRGVKGLLPDLYLTGYIICSQRSLLDHELSKLKPAGMILQPHSCSKSVSDKPSDKLCRECTMRVASCKCDRCDFIMCKQCFQKIHSTSNALRQHQALPLESINLLSTTSMECKEHANRLLEYYCEDDNKPICSKCVIEGGHKSHGISSMEEKNKTIITEMEPAVHIANKVVRKVRGVSKTLNDYMPDMKQETSAVIHEIREHFQSLHALLQAREYQLVEEVYSKYRSGMEPLALLKTQMIENSQKLELAIKAAQKILNNNELTLNAKDVLDELAHAREVPCIVQPKKQSSKTSESTPATNNPEEINTTQDGDKTVINTSDPDKIRFCFDKSLEQAIMTYSGVEGSVPLRLELHSIQEMPEELVYDDTDSVGGESTPLDSLSVISTADTASSEDVIIEDEHDVIITGGVELQPKSQKGINKVPKSKVKGSIASKCQVGTGEEVYVVHIKNPCQFMVHKKRDTDAIRALNRNLNNWGNSPIADREVPKDINIGDIVIARFTKDNLWYRARIKGVIGDNEDRKVEVYFIDYGNSEAITMDRVRKMQPRFMKYPDFLIECSLFDIIPIDKAGWSTEAVNKFAKITEGKCLFMSVIREVNNILLVDLSQLPLEDAAQDAPISIRDALVFLELAHFISPACGNLVGMPAVKREFLKPEPRSKGDVMEVVVSHAGTPSFFYVQELGENSECIYFAQYMKDLQEDYRMKRGDQLTIYSPKIGMVCCVQFSADNNWYRAIVLDLPGHKQVHVQYVDFGNDEIVPYWRLRILLDKYITFPAQAIKCRLSDVEPSSSNQIWSSELLEWWTNRTTMKQYKLVVQSLDLDGMMAVTLSHLKDMAGFTLNGEMVTLGHANSTGAGSAPVPLEFCNLENSESSEDMSQSSETSSSIRPSNGTSVGSTCSSRSLTPIGTPKGSPRKPVSPKSESVSPNITNKKSSGHHIKTTKQTKDLKLDTEIASSKGGALSTNPSPKSLSGDNDKERVEVQIAHFESPSVFYLHLVSGIPDLERLMEDMRYYYGTSRDKSDWKEGDYCAALNHEDLKWYRVKVVDIVGVDTVQVYAVDYGFKMEARCKDLQTLKREHKKHAVIGFACHLADIIPAGDVKKWSKTACETMLEEMHNKRLFVKQKGEVIPGSLAVDLLVEEEIPESALEPAYKYYYSITEKLKNAGLGIPKRKSKRSTISIKEEPKFTAFFSYIQPVLPMESSVVALPVYVDFNGVIYLQEIRQDDVLKRMTERLQDKFKDSEAHKAGEIVWEVDQACGVHFHLDDQWYRGQILQVDPHRIKVRYVDYGNVEFVSYDKLRADIHEFSTTPIQCFKAQLANTLPVSNDGEWPKKVLDFIHRSVVGQGCVIDTKVRDEDPQKPLLVDLMLPDKRDLSTVLVQLGLALRPDDLKDTLENSLKIDKILQRKNPYKKPILASVGEYFPVAVTAVETPDIVYFQHLRTNGEESSEHTDDINHQLTMLIKLSTELNVAGPAAPQLQRPKPGLPCCVQWSYDNCWYRAIVVSVVNHVQDVLVVHVDFGSSEICPIHRVRELPPMFTELPSQAIRMKLCDACLPTGEKSWTKTVLTEVMACTLGKELICCLKRHSPVQGDLYLSESKDWSTLKLAYQDLIDRGMIQCKENSMLDVCLHPG